MQSHSLHVLLLSILLTLDNGVENHLERYKRLASSIATSIIGTTDSIVAKCRSCS